MITLSWPHINGAKQYDITSSGKKFMSFDSNGLELSARHHPVRCICADCLSNFGDDLRNSVELDANSTA